MTAAYIIGFILASPLIFLAVSLIVIVPLTVVDYFDNLRKRLKTRKYHRRELRYYEGFECVVRDIYDDSPWRW